MVINPNMIKFLETLCCDPYVFLCCDHETGLRVLRIAKLDRPALEPLGGSARGTQPYFFLEVRPSLHRLKDPKKETKKARQTEKTNLKNTKKTKNKPRKKPPIINGLFRNEKN